MSDKYSAVWVSHSSISDYLKCPKAYYLNNIYKDPKTGHKIAIIQPPLALGQAVHEVLESLSVVPTDQRFDTPLPQLFEKAWEKVTGKLGGFFDQATEDRYKASGLEMLTRVTRNPGPLARKAVKIAAKLPHYYLSQDDNIILCGKIDWLEYLPEEDSVSILDFKTGRKREDPDSLQLPIYHLLVHNCQKRRVASASYWYLVDSDVPEKVELPSLEEAHKQILQIAKRIKLARQLGKFECQAGSECWACRDFQAIVRGEAELVGVNDYNNDVYAIKSSKSVADDSQIL